MTRLTDDPFGDKIVRWRIAGLLIILAYGAALRAYDLTAPWGRHLLGINGAWHSIIGRNHLRYGFATTRGAAILNPGEAAPDEWVRYLHHPPLLDWLLTLVFSVLGVHEWAARLVPFGFSLGTIVLTYRLAGRLFPLPSAVEAGDRSEAAAGRWLPLWAALFMATIPMSAIYGMHVDYQGSMVLFFALAAISAYERLLATQQSRYGYLLLAMFTLCALTDWPGFYLPPILAVHAFTRGRARAESGEPRSRVERQWAGRLLVFSVLLLAAIFLYFQLISGDLTYVLRKFLHRTYRFEDDSRRNFGLEDWLGAVGRYQRSLNSLPMLLAAGVWIGLYLVRRIQRRTSRADGFIWILLVFGLIHIVVPVQSAYVHDCVGIYLTPGLALCAAVGVSRVFAAGGTGRSRPLVRGLAAGAVAIAWVAWAGRATFAYPLAAEQKGERGHPAPPIVVAKLIRERTSPHEGAVVVGEDDCTPALWFYADRPLTPFVASPEDLQALMANPKYWGPECFPLRSRARVALVVLPEQDQVHYPRLRAYLDRYPMTRESGHLVFDLRASP